MRDERQCVHVCVWEFQRWWGCDGNSDNLHWDGKLWLRNFELIRYEVRNCCWGAVPWLIGCENRPEGTLRGSISDGNVS